MNEIELQLNLLLYLDTRRILLDMKDACERFLDQLDDKTVWKFPPLRYLLHVDVMYLFDTFPELGDFLLKEPLKLQRYCNDTLYTCLKSLNHDMIQHVQPTQVAVNIRLSSLPTILYDQKHIKYENMLLLQGLLIEISKPKNYVYHSVWCCPDECDGNEIILHYIPKVPPKCNLCKNVLYENSGLRRCGEQVTATFKFKHELLPKVFTIFDDLIEKLKLGSKYIVHVIVLKKLTTVWSLEEVLVKPAPPTTVTPPDIKQLYDACNGVPWKFIYCLASSIGVHVCPLNCFMSVKINLLLSLASVKAHFQSQSPILHVLAAGSDTGYVARLMTQAATIADSYTFLGTSQNSVPLALIGSSGGVCLLPLPLQSYSQKYVHSILSSIENGKFSHNSNESKLRCAVWAQGKDLKKITLYNVGNVFGNVCRGDHGDYTDELADNNLQNAISPPETTDEETQALRDISTYISIVASIRVGFTEEAELLLHNYFLAARKESPKAVTIGNLGALISSCATSARLCRRRVAQAQDAVFAVWLHIAGMPDQRFAPPEYLDTPADINKLDKVMKKFINWLEQFTGCPI